MSLVRHWPDWERARVEYANIDRPTLLVYGDHDWSRVEEREADRQAIPGTGMRVIGNAGHFLSLDAPAEAVQAIVEFAERRLP
jgi:pimeloyl-ACP methyl ester carboxylesterase